MEMFSVSILLLFCTTQLTCAKNSLLPGESLYPNQSLVSPNGEFGFGLIEEYYTGIWFWHGDFISDYDRVVNIFNPLPFQLGTKGNFSIGQTGELILSTNLEPREQDSIILLLLDTGNLILCDRLNSSNVMWQSFDHPTNTWLPGAWLGHRDIHGHGNGQNITRSLVSWEPYYDPTPDFLLEIDRLSGGCCFFVKRLDGRMGYFDAFPSWLPIQYNHGLITISNPFHLRLNSFGGVEIWEGGKMVYTNKEFCMYETCKGCWPSYTACILSTVLSNAFSGERCPYGLEPSAFKDVVQNFSVGCVTNASVVYELGNFLNDYDKVSVLDNFLQLPGASQYMGVLSLEDCQNICARDHCTAYTFHAGHCDHWYGDEFEIYIIYDHADGVSVSVDIPQSISKHKNIKVIIIVISIIMIVCLLFLWIFLRKLVMSAKPMKIDDSLGVYTYRQIKNATKNFSSKLGEGGFGAVFKGQLFDSTEIAVKKLKITSNEEKQFRTEVQTLGIIRHINLVGLLGFCAEGRKRLLVYQYMSNGSLDSHLFKEGSNLSWKNRYQILLGIAKGLAYLHEQCRYCIIHCDIKPENVLLDEHFSPKIADFGMAKLLGRDFNQVLTTTRGTIGYLAPEWISGEAITQKVDVYSFGMVVFEIISGRRNASKFNNRRYSYFPLYAVLKINEGEALCLLDDKISSDVNEVELNRACRVAGWCIQDSEAHRPCMGDVVRMLEGVVDVGIPPVPCSLLNLVDAEDY